MNIRFLFFSALVTTLFFSGVIWLVGNYTAAMTVDSFRMLDREKTEAFLRVSVDSFRNQLLMGNVTSVRNTLSGFMNKNAISGYSILHDEKVLDQSDSLDNDLESYSISVPVMYDEAGSRWGNIIFTISNKNQKILMQNLKSGIFSSIYVLMGLLIFLFFGIYATLWSVSRKIAPQIESTLKNGKPFVQNRYTTVVWSPLVTTLNLVSRNVQEWHANAVELERLSQISVLATQVAHDIRSPLSALTMVVGSLDELSESKRTMIKNAVVRINDIANDLLTRGKVFNNTSKNLGYFDKNSVESNVNTPVFIFSLIETLLTEKRYQFREGHINIEVDYRNSAGAFASVNAMELQRLLSNILNNSFEAIGERVGVITIAVRQYSKAIEIVVKDDGSGIEPEVLAKLGNPGVTFGKKNGNGIGLYAARKYLTSIGGKLKVESKLGAGTMVHIELPRAATPNWFLSDMLFTSNDIIICLDDDPSIHDLWQNKIKNLNEAAKNIQIFCFTQAEEFRNFLSNKKQTNGKEWYLIDYELLGQGTDGLRLIADLKLSDNVVLVTSRFDEVSIQEKCENLKIKLLPKNIAGFVSISVV